MAKLALLGLERSVYTRIARLALEEKQVNYILEEVEIFKDGGPPQTYLEHHPFGRIPCLIHDDFCVYETGAITRYIDDAFSGPSLQPVEAVPRARMNQIISVLDAYAYLPMIWEVFVQRISAPEESGLPNERVIFDAMRPIGVVLEQINLWLNGKDFLAGDSLTLADLYGFPMLLYFDYTPDGAMVLESYPALQQWLLRMKERSSVETTKSLYG